MANLTRKAKSGGDWTSLDLRTYNITVELQDSLSFFGRELLSIDHLDPNLLSTADSTVDHGFSKDTYRFLAYLKRASRANTAQDNAAHELAKSVLEVTGFDQVGTMLLTHYDIQYTICADGNRTAKTDICLFDWNSMILLVVHENPIIVGGRDPEPKVIAEAIATFQHNNRRREETGRDPLDTMTIPCITFVGTRPTFYMVRVTEQLSQSVITGQYPEQTTVVTRCIPPPSRRIYDGMELLEYRKAALQYYVTFRQVAKECWCKFIAESV